MRILPKGAAETRSVWTIDLAYGLKNSGVSNFFCTTISNCVDPAHEELGFYSKGFSDDEKRINTLIGGADGEGIVVKEECVADQDLARCNIDLNHMSFTSEQHVTICSYITYYSYISIYIDILYL